MFVHVATLYSVRPECADRFIQSIRAGGDFHRAARCLAPDLIAFDLLQHQSSPTPLFLCIDFWASKEKYLRARNSAVYDYLLSLRNQLAAATIEFGAFMFPPPAEMGTQTPKSVDFRAGTKNWGKQ